MIVQERDGRGDAGEPDRVARVETVVSQACTPARLELIDALHIETRLRAGVVAFEDSLAEKVRGARAKARQGDLFTPAASEAFRKILREMDALSWRIIMDVNPGQFPQRVNDSYPRDKPLSTMPPDLLARLPRLPEGVQYRFVGSTLILHDIKTNLVIDRLPEAIPISAPPRRR